MSAPILIHVAGTPDGHRQHCCKCAAELPGPPSSPSMIWPAGAEIGVLMTGEHRYGYQLPTKELAEDERRCAG